VITIQLDLDHRRARMTCTAHNLTGLWRTNTTWCDYVHYALEDVRHHHKTHHAGQQPDENRQADIVPIRRHKGTWPLLGRRGRP